MLEQAWILFGVADTERLKEAFKAQYGDAIHTDDVYDVFDNWQIAIRKDKHEVLMGSRRLAEIWKREGIQ